MAARAVTWLQDRTAMEVVAGQLRQLRWTGELTALTLRQLKMLGAS
jgi:hypothetical protein